MKYSKVFTLLQGLPAKEIKRLKGKVKLHKRKTLATLFIELTKYTDEDEPEADVVFKSVFGKSYSKKQDYLLRNEYRLLYDWLLENLANKATPKDNASTIAILSMFLDMKLYELFADELKAAWKKGVQTDDTTLLLQLSDLNIKYHIEGKPQSLANAEETAALSMQRIALLQSNLLHEVRKEEIRLRMNERIISAYKPLSEPYSVLQKVDLEQLEKNDLYAQYLSLRAQINLAKGSQKIILLKHILKNESLIRKYEPNTEEALCRFWVNLAQEYYLSSDFESAVQYYQKAEPQLAELPTPLQETFVLNYTLALMRNEQFEKARTVANAHSKLLLNSKILASRSPFLLAMLHLYAKDAHSAEKYVTLENKKEGSEFHFFMRIILSAVYYLRGDIELAVRESINVDQAVNYELNREQTLQTKISKPIVSLFRRFYSIIQGSTKEELKKELRSLSKEIEVGLKSHNNQSPNSILVDWISKEIMRTANQ